MARASRSKTARRPRYVSWTHLGVPCTQMIKKVWGLGRNKHCIDLTIICDNPVLMDMDAPDVMPAGSMLREENEFPEATYFKPRASVVLREG